MRLYRCGLAGEALAFAAVAALELPDDDVPFRDGAVGDDAVVVEGVGVEDAAGFFGGAGADDDEGAAWFGYLRAGKEHGAGFAQFREERTVFGPVFLDELGVVDVGVFNRENSHESAPLKTVSKHAWTVPLRIVQGVPGEVLGGSYGIQGGGSL